MQEHRTAAAGDRGLCVVIDLDDEIVEMIVALQPVASVIMPEGKRPIIMATRGVFTPGIIGTDGANRQKGPRSRTTIGAPPQLPWPESSLWGPAVALALVGDDTTPPQRDRDDVGAGGEPATAGVTGRSLDPNRR